MRMGYYNHDESYDSSKVGERRVWQYGPCALMKSGGYSPITEVAETDNEKASSQLRAIHVATIVTYLVRPLAYRTTLF